MATIRKNGKAYDSGDVVISILGAIESEVYDISYNTTQVHQRNRGLANDAHSWSMGDIDHTASITLSLAAVSKLEKLANGNLLALAPFDINVSFINEFNDLINDTLVVKFQSQGRTVDGGMDIKQQFELFSLGNEYNNA